MIIRVLNGLTHASERILDALTNVPRRVLCGVFGHRSEQAPTGPVKRDFIEVRRCRRCGVLGFVVSREAIDEFVTERWSEMMRKIAQDVQRRRGTGRPS